VRRLGRHEGKYHSINQFLENLNRKTAVHDKKGEIGQVVVGPNGSHVIPMLMRG
jgi:hypothetical protein